MSIKKSDVESFAIGVGSYYFLSWIFMFYPAYIVALQVFQIMVGNNPGMPWEPYACVSAVVMVVGWVFLLIITLLRRYIMLVTIYIVTAWPMLHQIISWCNGVGQGSDEWLAPVDWWIFW